MDAEERDVMVLVAVGAGSHIASPSSSAISRPEWRADEHQQTKARVAHEMREGERYQIGLATTKCSSAAMADRRDEISACVRFRPRETTRAGPIGAQGGGAREGKRNRAEMD